MTSSSSIDEAKRLLRIEMLERRRALNPDERADGAAAIAASGLGFVEPAAGAVISGYSAIRDELDPALLLAGLASAGHPLALPVTVARGKALLFRCWEAGASLERGDFSVPVPGENASVVVPGILLVPLLAFDLQGYRLGYGAGYYDRTLAQLRSDGVITAIGLAFDVQQVENVPRDGYDEPLDWVLTPSGPKKIGRV